MIADKFDKQPAEVQDYDIDFNEYLTAMADTGDSHTVVAATGITVDASTLAAGVVKVWLSGGTHGTNYKITATLTTTGGRVKEHEILIRVRDI